jgi:hypothetical protein
LLASILPAKAVIGQHPKMMVRIDDRKGRFEDRLLVKVEPFLGTGFGAGGCCALRRSIAKGEAAPS